MNPKLLSLQKKLSEDGILISFSGKFSQEIIEELGQAVKKYLETEEQPKADKGSSSALHPSHLE